MQDDIRKALAELEGATLDLRRILSLPTEIGARVQWRVNGVIWERTGEDAWVPVNNGPQRDETWPSSHIASTSGWTTEIDETRGSRL